MNNYLIILCLATLDIEVHKTKQEAEYHVYECCALEEINTLLLANLN